jgi:predicted GIY-YIG superfamily endonuclease
MRFTGGVRAGALRSFGEGGLERHKRDAMHYVYCLKSETKPGFRYVGYSANLKQRLVDHNQGINPSTAGFVPLHVEGYVAFRDKERALAFERYLKSGSGRAFSRKRLW